MTCYSIGSDVRRPVVLVLREDAVISFCVVLLFLRYTFREPSNSRHFMQQEVDLLH